MDDVSPPTNIAVRAADEGTVVEVYVQPRAARNEVSGVYEGRLKLRLTAPPVEGEANRECVRFMARLLGASTSSVSILHGSKSRRKTVLVRGMTPREVLDRLEGRDRPSPPAGLI